MNGKTSVSSIYCKFPLSFFMILKLHMKGKLHWVRQVLWALETVILLWEPFVNCDDLSFSFFSRKERSDVISDVLFLAAVQRSWIFQGIYVSIILWLIIWQRLLFPYFNWGWITNGNPTLQIEKRRISIILKYVQFLIALQLPKGWIII